MYEYRRLPMEKNFKRVNVMILEEQYERLSEQGLNLSGLVRDLLGDYLSHSSVTIRVSDETRRVYDLVVSNTGATDEDIEAHLRVALARVLESRIQEMQALHSRLIEEAAG